jgi:hypothetical protein
MDRIITGGIVVLLGLAVLAGLTFFGGSLAAIADATGVLDRADAQIAVEQANAEARRAEADADKIRAQAEGKRAEADARAVVVQAEADAQERTARAQAEKTQAEADYLLHEAAAGAVEQNTRLVRWYAIRGDVRYVVTILCGLMPLAIACGIAVGSVAWNLYERRHASHREEEGIPETAVQESG